MECICLDRLTGKRVTAVFEFEKGRFYGKINGKLENLSASDILLTDANYRIYANNPIGNTSYVVSEENNKKSITLSKSKLVLLVEE